MKLVVMYLLAVFTTVSNITAASDTLTITSSRLINTCSGENRWLILVSLGEIYASDSLMSFDITIGYDTALIRPTDGLWVGTLADKMRFGDLSPFLNLRVPGEMRVGAFTISTPVKGNQPLFAVAGDFKGTCSDADTFTFPFYPEYNSEFKVETKVLKSDTIIAVAIPMSAPNQGTSFDIDTVTLRGKDSTAQIPLTIQTALLNESNIEVELQLESPLPARIDSITWEGSAVIDSVKFSDDGSQARIFLTADTQDEINGTVHVSSVTDDTLQTRIITSTEAQGTCLCLTPTLTDTTLIQNIKQQIVSVRQDVHEGSGIRIALEGSTILIQGHHGLPGVANLVDVLGRTLRSTHVQEGSSNQLSLENMLSGVYYVVVVSEGKYIVRKIEL